MHLHYYMTTSPTNELVDINTGEIYSQRTGDRLVDLGDVNVYQANVEKTRQSIHEAVRAIVGAGAFPVILGGEHYITFPSFTGFADALAERGSTRIGYMQLDAHFDLAPDNPIFGGIFTVQTPGWPLNQDWRNRRTSSGSACEVTRGKNSMSL